MKFRPDIEGLRALAILPVVAFHAYPSAMPGGFVGVDVFFVISGFLITQLLMQRLGASQYSIVSFYAARVRRIFPALFFMLALSVPIAVLLLAPRDLQGFGRLLSATALFYSNMSLYQTTDYFDVATELKPLVHTWSLAVEEQYYIVFPLLLAALHRFGRQVMAPFLAALGLLSLLLSMWWTQHDTPMAFYSALSRTFELMLGSLVAVSAGSWCLPQRAREIMSAVGLILIVASCLWLTPKLPFPGPSALLPCFGAALLIAAGVQGTSHVGQWISTPLLRWFGALSFSLYLWHWPVLVFTRHLVLGEPQGWQVGLALVVALALAWVSLNFVEGPVRRAKLSNRTLLLAGGACMALSLVVGWALAEKTHTFTPLSAHQHALYDGSKDVSPERRRCHGGQKQLIEYKDRCVFGDRSSSQQTAVWADSHGVELAYALGEIAQQRGYSVAQITSSACPPAPGFVVRAGTTCVAHNEATLAALINDKAVNRVVLVARYNHYLRLDDKSFTLALQRAAKALATAGKELVIVEPFPSYHYPVPEALLALDRRSKAGSNWGQLRADYLADNRFAFELIADLSKIQGASTWQISNSLCQSVFCDTVDGDHALYFDDNHISMRGARRSARSLPSNW